MNVLYIKIESQNLEQCVSKTSDNIQIKIKMPNQSQESPVSSKSPNEELKDMDVLCNFKIKIESQNLEHGFFKDQLPYSNQDPDANPHSETSSVRQSPGAGLKGHGCYFHLQNQDTQPIFVSWMYKILVTTSKTRLRLYIPVWNLQHSLKLQIRT